MAVDIPNFPITKPSETEAMVDFIELKESSFIDLFQNNKWKSRSVIDEQYCFDYIVDKSNIGNKSS
ncbi:MAG: hypothetical protein QGI31_09930, partial [Dehalococcoidia bacterium]|nr:hypothetical protein [Dehalococcoidia bacterium]